MIWLILLNFHLFKLFRQTSLLKVCDKLRYYIFTRIRASSRAEAIYCTLTATSKSILPFINWKLRFFPSWSADLQHLFLRRCSWICVRLDLSSQHRVRNYLFEIVTFRESSLDITVATFIRTFDEWGTVLARDKLSKTRIRRPVLSKNAWGGQSLWVSGRAADLLAVCNRRLNLNN